MLFHIMNGIKLIKNNCKYQLKKKKLPIKFIPDSQQTESISDSQRGN